MATSCSIRSPKYLQQLPSDKPKIDLPTTPSEEPTSLRKRLRDEPEDGWGPSSSNNDVRIYTHKTSFWLCGDTLGELCKLVDSAALTSLSKTSRRCRTAAIPEKKARLHKLLEERVLKNKWDNDPEFTKRLGFTTSRNLLVHGSLMMGMYDSHRILEGKAVPAHLLAYDMNTEKIVWEIPLISGIRKISDEDYTLTNLGKSLALH